MKPDSYMKLYVGDWLQKTLQMDAACQGAYLLMILAHWGKPHLTFNNEDEIRALCRVPIQDWARVKATIVQKFDVVDGNKWVNDRCVREYREAVELYNLRQKQTEEARKVNPKHLKHGLLQSTDGIVTNPESNDVTGPYPQLQQKPYPSGNPESKSTFDAVRLANQIISDKWGWWWDNCKVKPEDFKTRPLASVIEAFLPKSESEIQAAWIRAVKIAHAAVVDGLVKGSAAGYCIQCFRAECK